jgi:hypothetical protein
MNYLFWLSMARRSADCFEITDEGEDETNCKEDKCEVECD